MALQNWENCLKCNISREEFWTAVDVWEKKPHVVNRRLWGTSQLHKFWIAQKPSWDFYRAFRSENISEEELNVKEKCLSFLIRNTNMELGQIGENLFEIIIVKQLPKLATDPSPYQMVAKDYTENIAYFVEIYCEKEHKIGPVFPYSFHYDAHEISLKGQSAPSDAKSVKWLRQAVLPQIVKWGVETRASESQPICSSSLSLVDNEVYYTKYNQLKLKYGKQMVKIWPERTDPAKFVYEDVAIASYLLVLWEAERRRLGTDQSQSFVDLGCGNGLLVYILASEGHSGYGVDVRKRQIWDMYPSHVVLKEQTISPSDVYLFPDTEWIIGNHSDELTPWIPVIAACSSYKCNFFVLPCCCYNFNGSKYQRKDSSKSQYREYLEHIQRLCEQCGFKTAIDRLKIPSTKRICLIGTDRLYREDCLPEICTTIQKKIAEKNEGEVWISDFKPRQAKEKVRNCTQLDKSLIKAIVSIISGHLIKDCKKGEAWCLGHAVELSVIVNTVPKELLKELKSECGGLQTVLRNNHQIFKIESGKVQLRYPQTMNELAQIKNKRKKIKAGNIDVQKKACWFYNNHPQGCPLTCENCSYLHILE